MTRLNKPKLPVGRPPLPKEERRSSRVTIRFTPGEIAKLRARARANRTTPSAYLLALAMM